MMCARCVFKCSRSGQKGRYKRKPVKSLARGGTKIGEEEFCNRGHIKVRLDLRSTESDCRYSRWFETESTVRTQDTLGVVTTCIRHCQKSLGSCSPPRPCMNIVYYESNKNSPDMHELAAGLPGLLGGQLRTRIGHIQRIVDQNGLHIYIFDPCRIRRSGIKSILETSIAGNSH